MEEIKLKRKLLVVLAMVFTVATMVTGCGEDKASETESASKTETGTAKNSEEEAGDQKDADTESRKVVVVTSGAGEPYSLLDENQKWSGIDAEMWAEIGKRTGWEIEVKQASFDSLFGELDSGRADVAANCFGLKEERSEKYYPSMAYYGDSQCVAVKGDNTEINSFEDFAGKKIGVTSGQASETILEDMSEELGFELVVYESLNTGYGDVDLGRIDGMGGPVTGANRYMDASGQELHILDEKLMANNVGYYFQKTEEGKELCDEVNKVIEEMLADGTIASITEKWLLEDMTAYITEES